MPRRTGGLWKTGLALTSTLLLLVLMAWVPAGASAALQRAPKLTTPGTESLQTTPTEDATVTTLSKEKLAQEVEQLKQQNAPDFLGWLKGNASTLLSTLLVVAGGIFGLLRYLAERTDAQKRLLEDRQAERARRDEEQKRWIKYQESEREKRAEERFQAVVEGLSGEREEAKVGAAILLRTFLHPDYQQFYTQTFDLAVAHLRLRRTSHSPEDLDTSLPLTTLSQALVAVFKEVFPLARSLYPDSEPPLVARGVQLDNAYLEKADLEGIWMPQASLRNVDLSEANLRRANLSGADIRDSHLTGADLHEAELGGAKLMRTNFTRATLNKAQLTRAELFAAKLRDAKLMRATLNEAKLYGAELFAAKLNDATLVKADLNGAKLNGADLNGAKLNEANLHGADLSRAKLNGARFNGADLSGAKLTEANLEEARSLKGANLRGVKGLSKEQLALCKAKGALIDENSTTSSSQPLLHSKATTHQLHRF